MCRQDPGTGHPGTGYGAPQRLGTREIYGRTIGADDGHAAAHVNADVQVLQAKVVPPRVLEVRIKELPTQSTCQRYQRRAVESSLHTQEEISGIDINTIGLQVNNALGGTGYPWLLLQLPSPWEEPLSSQ